ncbi:hypothetical protein GCM10020370_32240 [Paenibacillus hodogayensis]
MDLREYVKTGFETYYARFSQVTEQGFCRWMRPDIPDDMKVTEAGLLRRHPRAGQRRAFDRHSKYV